MSHGNYRTASRKFAWKILVLVLAAMNVLQMSNLVLSDVDHDRSGLICFFSSLRIVTGGNEEHSALLRRHCE